MLYQALFNIGGWFEGQYKGKKCRVLTRGEANLGSNATCLSKKPDELNSDNTSSLVTIFPNTLVSGSAAEASQVSLKNFWNIVMQLSVLGSQSLEIFVSSIFFSDSSLVLKLVVEYVARKKFSITTYSRGLFRIMINGASVDSFDSPKRWFVDVQNILSCFYDGVSPIARSCSREGKFAVGLRWDSSCVSWKCLQRNESESYTLENLFSVLWRRQTRK